jgi:O-antigen/teichoic acid export membrane protein
MDSMAPTKPQASLLSQLLPWAKKGGYALADQGLISGSNFLISVLLARWLTRDGYGAYAVAFGIFVLLTVLYQSLVLEPMSVFGGSNYRNNLREYLRVLIWLHFSLCAVLCGALGIWVGVAYKMDPHGALPLALAGVTIASPLVLIFGLARRAFYLELTPASAALGALWYCAFAMVGLWLAFHYGLLSAFSAFIAIGAAALATSLLLLRHLRANLRPRTGHIAFAEVCREHWRYGRWALIANVASWVPAYLFYPILSSFAGLVASGQLRALMNLAAPMQQAQTAMALLFLPYASRLRGEGGDRKAASLNWRITLLAVTGATLYWAVIIVFKTRVFHLLYSGKYMEVAGQVPFVAVGAILWAASFGPTVVLRALQSPKLVFVAYAIATVLSLVIGIPATYRYGLWGAILAINVSDLLSLLLMMLLLRRRTGQIWNRAGNQESNGAGLTPELSEP